MKKIFCITITLSLLASKSYSQIDKLYDDKKWEIHAQYVNFSYNENPSQSESFSFINPFGMRLGIDQVGTAKNHFYWNPRLGIDAIWGVLLGLVTENKINDFDAFDSWGVSSGILGQFNWTKNIISKDNLVVAAGIEFGDYSTGSSGYHGGIGPSVLTDYAISENIALGINLWASKSLASTDELSKGMWFYGVFPRILFKKGWFIQPGVMFTSEENNEKYSRFEINIGKKIGN